MRRSCWGSMLFGSLVGVTSLLSAVPHATGAQAASAAKPDANRVAVAWFENRTRDRKLNAAGAEAAAAIAGALAKEKISVVAAADVSALSTGALKGAKGRSVELSKSTSAGALVRGSYAKKNGAVEWQAEVLDGATGKVLFASVPIRADGAAAYDALSEGLVFALNVRKRWGDAAGLAWPAPKSLAVWREYQKAEDVFNKSDWAGALALYKGVETLDPTFAMAKYGIWVSYGNLGNAAASDSMQKIMEPLMAAKPGPLADVYAWLDASHRGDVEAMYAAGKKQYALDPAKNGYLVALPAVRTGRYTEVVELYPQRDMAPEAREWRPWDGVALFSYHLLGRHEDELAAAEENLARRGFDWGTQSWMMYALASQGRSADVEALLIRDTRELKENNTNTLGGPLSVAGWEYMAHGHPDMARAMWQRRLDYYLGLPADRQKTFAAAIANSHLLLGHYGEAVKQYEALSAAAPTNLPNLGYLGIAATLAGDEARARAVEAKLTAFTERRQKVGALYWRSFIASQRGDCAQAVTLRVDGLKQGLSTNDYLFHWWNSMGRAKSCTELPALTGQRK